MSGLGLGRAKKLVVWLTASHAFWRAKQARLQSVCRAAGAQADVRLVVKLHPAENQRAALYRQNKSLRPPIIGRNGLTTLELIAAADAVITNGWCSTGVESILCGKPVIALDFESRAVPPYVSLWRRAGCAGAGIVARRAGVCFT